jgi:hypothetical protein
VVDIALLVGRLVLVALLYLFLFAVMKTGIGLVKGQNKKERHWTLTVEHGPKELRGVKLTVTSPIVIGRAPGSDILIPLDVVSGRHARFSLMGTGLMVEDLGSTNGTFINGTPVQGPTPCESGDTVSVGTADIKIGFK